MRNLKRTLLSTCVLGWIVTGFSAIAQAGPPPVVTQASNEDPSTSTSQDIVVTAQRRSESLSKTPVAVSVISGETLAKLGVSSQSDLHTAVPGLLIKASQSSNQLNYSIRGQSLEPFSSIRPGVLPYVNEVQIGGEGANALYDLQSVQVLKGPQGTLFGRNATGGAVLFTTTKPSDVFGGYVSGRIGDYSLRQVEGAVNIPIIGDKLMARIAGDYEYRDGFQYNLFDGRRLGDVRRQGLRGSLTFAPGGGFKNELVVDYFHSGGTSTSAVISTIAPQGQAGPNAAPANILFSPQVDAIFGPGSWNRYLAAHPGADPDGIVAFAAKQKARGPFLIDVDSDGAHQAHDLVITNISTLDVAPNTQIKNVFGYTNLHSVDIGEFDGTPYGIDSGGTQGRNIRTRQYSEELQLVGKTLGDRLRYVTGLYYADELVNNRSQSIVFDIAPLLGPFELINSAKNLSKTYAIYGQGTYDLDGLTGIHGLSVTAGARYTSEKISLTRNPDDLYVLAPKPIYHYKLQDTFKKVSWQFGLQEQLNPNLLLYVVTRRSFRSGGFNFYAPPLGGFGDQLGAEYKPQIVTDVEAGAKFSGRIEDMPFRANLAVYNLWLKDNQNVTYLNINGTASAVTVNVPRAKVSGFEFDAVLNPYSWVSTGSTLNYTNARYTKNLVSVLGSAPIAFGPYPDTPKWSGSVYAELTIPISGDWKATIRGDGVMQSGTVFSSTQSTLNPGARIPGYAMADFRVGLENGRDGWSLSANLKNAFNRTYYVGGLSFESVFTLDALVPGEPRTFFVQLRKTF